MCPLLTHYEHGGCLLHRGVASRKVLIFWEAGLWLFFEMAQQLLTGYQVALNAVLATLAPVSTNKPSFWSAVFLMFHCRGDIYGLFSWIILSCDCSLTSNLNEGSKAPTLAIVYCFPKFNPGSPRMESILSWHLILDGGYI